MSPYLAKNYQAHAQDKKEKDPRNDGCQSIDRERRFGFETTLQETLASRLQGNHVALRISSRAY